MIIKGIKDEFSVCKVKEYSNIEFTWDYVFTGKTNDENSLVCLSKDVPDSVVEREDHWRAFYIDGILDFSLIGILSKISTILANAQIGIFAISTFNTDYIFVKEENYEKAIKVLKENGYEVWV